MANFSHEALPLKELRHLQKDLAKAICSYEDRHMVEARAKLDALAKEMGYSLADLIGVDGRASPAPADAKYRHPENVALTWSARVRKPLWYADHANTGKDPEQPRGLKTAHLGCPAVD